jgi:microcystin-dependent protein
MSEPYLGEIRIFSFGYAPRGWALCNGQILGINQNQALFAVLGVTYGGNGINNFALPNLQGSVPAHTGNGLNLGQAGGEASHTLLPGEIPRHSHLAYGSSAAPTVGSPAGNVWAANPNAYNAVLNSTMNPAGIANAGGGQPHENRSPFLTVNFCIALQGVFPSRS